jgi:MFS family permease
MRHSRDRKPHVQQIAAAVIGNALEWYDFLIFGFMLVVLSRLFFPASSEHASLLLATATFGAGFVMRPLGGLLIGIYADRHGRKAALQLIMTLMTIAMLMISLAPTHAAIGVAAPLIIVTARLLQGFATGGEFSSATAFLLEMAPPRQRGLYTSWQMFGQGLALLFGASVGALMTHALAPAAIDAWGWRIPFLLGLLIGPVGLWIRRHLDETSAFLAARQAPPEKKALSCLLREHWRQMAIVMGLTTFGTVAFYVLIIFMPTFAHLTLKLALADAFLAQVIAIAFMTLLMPLFGWLSDRSGRQPILLAAILVVLLAIYPLTQWLTSAPSLARLLLTQLILCGAVGAYFGPISAVLAEQFPAGLRSTGLAIGYNTAVVLFGGFAPFTVTWLSRASGETVAPFLYVLLATAIGLIAAIFVVDRAPGASLPVVDP